MSPSRTCWGHGAAILASRAWLTLADGYRSVNAAAESLIGLYKTELIRRRGPSKGLDNVELATL